MQFSDRSLEQTSVHHGQADDLLGQPLREGLHPEEEQVVSHLVLFLINFFNFQFSVSQFTWHIWKTNNGIKSNKQIESQRKCRCCAGSEKEFVVTKAWTHGPGHGAVYWWSEPSVIPLSYSGAPPRIIDLIGIERPTVPNPKPEPLKIFSA